MNQRSFALRGVAGLAACFVLGLPPAAGAADDVKVPKPSLRTPSGLDLDVVGDAKGFTLELTAEALAAGLDVVTLRLTRAVAETPPPLTLKWSIPSHDVAGQWTPTRHFDKGVKPDWARSRLEPSSFARSAPVICLFGHDNRNVLTFAASDALDTLVAGAGVREEDGLIYNELGLFSERHEKVKQYAIKLRIDRRRVPYHTALGELAAWWAAAPGYQPASVPPSARQPMYSTWYNYHQSLDPAVLLKELEVAKQIGFESIIIDDGWQTLDTQRGYAFTGDWRPERIPDMKGFVAAAHALGIKVLLWYAVPFVGKNAKVVERFKSKSLRFEERLGAYVIDPRYPEVRAYVIDTYRRALRDWGIDGFKLDFIDRFVADDKTVLEARDGRDYASVNEATDRMMTDVLGELRKQKPDLMIEFRQPYIGPLIRKYGNMFRAGDCPNSALANRVKTIDLRLLSGQTAVHADMIMWHPGEPVASAALQLLDILFAVPQLSVRLREVPPDHLQMVKFYTAYWNANRGVLLDGKLEPLFPAANYPIVIASAGDKQIVGLYGDNVVPLEPGRPQQKIDVVNAKSSGGVVLAAAAALGKYRYVIRDCLGKTTKQGQIQLRKGAVDFTVPPSGLLALERIGR
jgi:alpha-galactosidase